MFLLLYYTIILYNYAVNVMWLYSENVVFVVTIF
jgi:hypothetical protein